MADFKPNIYPIMYWALAFGAAAAVLLFVLFLLSQAINIAWFPVFLTGLVWGGYRNYKKQKQAWAATSGMPAATGSPMDEFRQAARDITSASRDLLQQEAPAEEEIVEAPLTPDAAPIEEVAPLSDEQSLPPTPPTPPQI